MAKTLSSHVPDALLHRLDAHCQAERRTRSQVVLMSIEEYLAVHAAPCAVVHDPKQTELFPENKKGPTP